jgi:hypothetical protein
LPFTPESVKEKVFRDRLEVERGCGMSEFSSFLVVVVVASYHTSLNFLLLSTSTCTTASVYVHAKVNTFAPIAIIFDPSMHSSPLHLCGVFRVSKRENERGRGENFSVNRDAFIIFPRERASERVKERKSIFCRRCKKVERVESTSSDESNFGHNNTLVPQMHCNVL